MWTFLSILLTGVSTLFLIWFYLDVKVDIWHWENFCLSSSVHVLPLDVTTSRNSFSKPFYDRVCHFQDWNRSSGLITEPSSHSSLSKLTSSAYLGHILLFRVPYERLTLAIMSLIPTQSHARCKMRAAPHLAANANPPPVYFSISLPHCLFPLIFPSSTSLATNLWCPSWSSPTSFLPYPKFPLTLIRNSMHPGYRHHFSVAPHSRASSFSLHLQLMVKFSKLTIHITSTV